MEISVIIPVHNAGCYLRPCLDSLLAQSFSDWELLLVTDCPTDGSGSVCAEYESDSRVRVIANSENLHIGMSRNRGLAAARGRYVTFVDHDDICAPDLLAELHHQIEVTGADVVFSPVRTTDRHDITNSRNFPTAVADRTRYALTDILEQGGLSLFNNVIGTLYRRETLDGIHFVDTRTFSAEDKLFNIEVLMHADSIAWVNRSLYTHRNHGHNTGVTTEYLFVRRGAAMERLWQQAQSWEPEWRESLLVGLFRQSLNMLAGAIVSCSPRLYYRTRCYLRHAAWSREAVREERIGKRGWRKVVQWLLLIQLR